MNSPSRTAQVLDMMNGVFEEIELAILREWPSKAAALSQRGIT